jgi:hypothetical protein
MEVVEEQRHSLLTSALDRGEVSGQWQAPATLPSVKYPGTHWTEDWVGPQMRPEKNLVSTGIQTPDRSLSTITLYRWNWRKKQKNIKSDAERELAKNVEWNLPITEQQGTENVSLVERFHFIQVFDVWILGTVPVPTKNGFPLGPGSASDKFTWAPGSA